MTHQQTKAFTRRSRFASLPSRMAVLTVICAVSLFAQTPGTASARPTLAEAEALLKAHPELQAGFKTPELASVTVTEAISGGFVFRHQSPSGYSGETTIVGPTTVIVDTGLLGKLIDKIVSIIILDGRPLGNKGCVSININAGTSTVETVVCN